MFQGFEQRRIRVEGAEINVLVGGSGLPVLLLHGYPQDVSVWGRVAPALAREHTVVATDLRGYGHSSVPEAGARHEGYSFRAMGDDQVQVMAALGHPRFAVVGHDRGARVGHRMALDHPEAVERLAAFDIVPTRHVLETTDAALATRYYHWFFLVQPELPERMVGLDPLYYLHASLGSLGSGLAIHPPEALRSYEAAFLDPARRHAMFEDYRAAAGIDQEHDRADADRLLPMPVLVLWAGRGVLEELYRPLDVWRRYARSVRGHALDSGHFLVDERPDEVTAEILAFLAEQEPPLEPAGSAARAHPPGPPGM